MNIKATKHAIIAILPPPLDNHQSGCSGLSTSGGCG
jgi:hypothetical protein